MARKTVVGVVVILIAIILVGWVAFSSRGVEMSDAGGGAAMASPAAAPSAGEQASGAKAGQYEPYAPAKLARAEQGKVVLFFRAAWCSTCRGLDADIRANIGKIPAEVAILDVNYDTATELKQKYGITYQHTFVQVDAEGNQIKKWTGSPTLAALLSQIK